MADDGMVIVLPPGEGDPKPLDIGSPEPADPQVPDDKAPAPQPGPQDGPDDKAPAPQPGPQDGPDDKAPAPQDDPTGPGGLTAPEPCPTHGVDCGGEDEDDQPELDQGCFTGCDLPEDPQGRVGGTVIPTRVDAGLSTRSATQEQGGLELTWLLAGGALVTATGAAFAARQRSRRKAVEA